MKRINYYLLIVLLIAVTTVSYAQQKPLLGQYFQNLPGYAPALTGSNEFLDLRMGTRQQWTGLDGAPRMVFLSGYGILKNKNEVNAQPGNEISEDKGKIKFKHAAGGYLQSNEQDLFKQLTVSLNYAVHVPVFSRTYLSFGMTTGLDNDKIDISNAIVKDEVDDLTYQSLRNRAATTRLNISAGLALNSERYYVAYSVLPIVNTLISGNTDLEEQNSYARHHVLLGGRFDLNQDLEMIPNGFVRVEKGAPVLFDAGIRARYQQKYWAGLSYRNTNSMIGMLGLTVDNKYTFSYSYEYGFSDFNSYNHSSHEIVLGLQLFNPTMSSSMW